MATTLTLPTRELTGLIGDVLPFASPDPDDNVWHRVILRYDGTRLHALAGDGVRLAWMSWGPDDVQAPAIPGLDTFDTIGGDPWEMAILPENAKEIATKFKLAAKDGDAPLRVVGSVDNLLVERDADAAGVALRSVALSRPWDDNAPRIDQVIEQVAADARPGPIGRSSMAYSGFHLADFCNPKVVRQRGPVVLAFGPVSSYVRIGRWFQGALRQAEIPHTL